MGGAAVRRAFGDASIEDVPHDFFVMATDLVTGSPIVLDHGPLGLSCLASGSLPGIFPPVRRGRMLLVDGGLFHNVPGPQMKARGASLVIAVDLSSRTDVAFSPGDETTQRRGWFQKLLRRSGKVREMLDAPRLTQVLVRSLELLMLGAVRSQAWSFDVHIQPDVAGFRTLRFKDHVPLVERGRQAALRMLPEIHARIAGLKKRVQADVDRAIETGESSDAPALQLVRRG